MGVVPFRLSQPLRPPGLTPTRWFLTILSFATVVGASVYIVASSWPVGGAPLGLPVWTHLLALACVGVELLCRVLKITFSGAAMGFPTPFGVAARTIMGGDFAASITPARSGAEPARFLVLTEAGIPVAGVLLILFVELFLEMVSLAVVALALALLMPRSGLLMRGLLITVLVYSSGILGAGWVAYVMAKRQANGPPPTWARMVGLSPGRWRKIQLSLRQLRSSIGSLRRARRGLMVAAFLSSLLHVCARLVFLPLIVYSYAPATPLAPLVLWPLLLLYGAAIAPAPGGGGVVEVAFNAALGGVLPGHVLAAALIWWRVYTFYILIAIGAIATGRTVMRALRKTADAPTARAV